ncbi:MAG: gamma-glutamyl-gamma-aminobutyrate hydrolase family protein, partial [Hyphomicrobiales bacterium]|nr:gamma-glutamyl-gamma-aminobutyrate hydrolase family protein [Hyphomicrobiales bacterium]
SDIRHDGSGVFKGIDAAFPATRYHSLIVERATLPRDLIVNAETADGLIMGLKHARLPIHGVQFHPESIASAHRPQLLKNFLDLAAAWNTQNRATLRAAG